MTRGNAARIDLNASAIELRFKRVKSICGANKALHGESNKKRGVHAPLLSYTVIVAERVKLLVNIVCHAPRWIPLVAGAV